jgi:hypothetical protein
MGTDIHSRVEVFLPRYQGSPRWVMIEDELFDAGWGDGRMTCDPFSDRNYTLFALLANVRNGYGFAGIVTGNPITPLDEPRGVPSNASLGWQGEVDAWDVNMHSHTWFTLRELLEPNPLYDQPLTRRGVIPGEAYEHLRDNGGTPSGWSGSVAGPGLLTVTIPEYEAGIRGERQTYVEYIWEDSLRDSCQQFHQDIQVLKKYADENEHAYDDVRVVLAFDN